MPLKPVTQTLQMPVETTSDVYALFEVGLQLVHHPSRAYLTGAVRDLEDHFYYLGAVHPEHVRPLQPELARLSDEQLKVFSFTFPTWLYLLHGADDYCIDYLTTVLSQHPKNWVRQQMLAAIGTPAALTNLAALARNYNLTDEFQDMGFEIPPDGSPAEPRFMLWRRAIRRIPFDGSREDLHRSTHPIGLPLADVIDDPTSEAISWHYLSLDLAPLEGLPTMLTKRLHLVSPPMDIGWTLYCDILKHGKYKVRSIERDERYSDESDDLLDEDDNDQPVDLGQAELLPYDHRLTYCNAHTMLTEGVVGDVGGPPIGLYANPKCVECKRLMFHILTVEANIRSYGDGWRSLFVCENCQLVACNATSWN